MDVPVFLVDLAGSVALLLWGVHMVRTGVQRAFGARLRRFLATTLRRRLSAFLAGIGVTAVLQSSTATGLMVTGFAAAGLVELAPALAVMLGANLGTTLIVQVLSFNVSAVAPALVLAGVVLFRRASAGLRDFGRVLIGLGLLLMALHQFVALLAPLSGSGDLRAVLGALSGQVFVDIVLAAALTWAAHSSVAIVLLVMSFASRGIVDPGTAFALVLGANLGTAINPVLEGAPAGGPAARRLPLGNLLNRIAGILVAALCLPWIVRLAALVEPSPERAVADFHTAFNLVTALVALPLLRPLARLLERLLPTRPDAADPARPRYLDPAARETPSIALGQAAREALRLADLLEEMLRGARDALARDDRRLIAQTRRLGPVLGRLNAAIKAYLSGLDTDPMTGPDHARLHEILLFATNIEQAGGIVDRSLLDVLARRGKRGLAFSIAGQTDLGDMLERLLTNTRVAASLFVTVDERAARLLAAEKETFRSLESSATASHFERLRDGRPESAETSALHLEALRAIKQVNARLVAAAAYPVLETRGELLPSRLRGDEEAARRD